MKKYMPVVFFLILSMNSIAFAKGSLFSRTIPVNAECQTFIDSIKDNYTFGWIETAINYEVSNSEKQNVFYYYKNTDQIKNPVLYFNGGPGASSHYSHLLFETTRKKFGLTENINYIFMDQRGTGCSSPGFTSGYSIKTLENLKWSASLGIVQDAEILRQHLLGKNTRWKIFGQSFGSYIVYRYIEKFPNSISKAYAHGYALGNSDYDASYYRILSQQTVLEKYFKLFPVDRNRLTILNKYLSDSQKCFLNIHNQELCGYEILLPFINLLGFSTEWTSLHVYLQRIVPEKLVDETALKNYVSQNVQGTMIYHDSEKFMSVAENAVYFYNFAGLFDWNNKPNDFLKCSKIYNQIQQQNPKNGGALLMNECQAPIQYHYNEPIAELLGSKIDLSTNQFVDIQTVNKNLIDFKMPLYTYSGELDPFIPKQLFAQQIKLFGPKTNYTHFEFSGHEGFYTERKIYLDMAQ